MSLLLDDFISADDSVAVVCKNKHGQERRFWRFFRERSGPQAFIVQVPEGDEVKPHFHRLNQFQVLFPAAGASYQQDTVDHLMVHYADAYRTYGPIRAGAEEALDFFTLRPRHDPDGAWIAYMPEDRHKAVRRGKRNLHASVECPPNLAELSEVATAQTLMDHEDALNVSVAWVGPGGAIETRDPSVGDGLYALVVGGSAVADGQTYPFRSLLWRAPGSGSARVEAGHDGLALLMMRFPAGSQVVHTEAA